MKMFHNFTKSAICLIAAAALTAPSAMAQEEEIPAQVKAVICWIV